MLLRETGQYLFEHTVRNVTAGGALDLVLLATDDQEVVDAAQAAGVRAVLTDTAHTSGTDRVHEAYGTLLEEDGKAYDVIINVQGDEPEMASEDLVKLIEAFKDPAVEFATLWTPFTPGQDVQSESAVKVVLDANGDALYFSRSPLPNDSHRRAVPSDSQIHKRHLGVYAFRPAALARFCSLPHGELEQQESLEQLRWLEAGHSLRVLRASHAACGIDTLDDYRAFVERQKVLLSNPPTP
ncbi:MAG: 3-deoxy-manno-octulosonate cytidylyltransferase (CMP-KDO synthetase) [Candidatus Paceibacteria bacterium]|jgi:3-deoxy-manno-octulosonate cytidylyltransferase (CMP-KDO synthetase)